MGVAASDALGGISASNAPELAYSESYKSAYQLWIAERNGDI